MLRRLSQFWAGPRAAAKVCPKAKSPFGTWPPRQSRQSSFFTHKVTFPRHGPRTRQPGYGRRVLRASPSGIYGTIFMSIVMLVPADSMDYQTRREVAFATFYHVMNAPDEKTKVLRFWVTGLELFARYAGAADAAEVDRTRWLVELDPASGWTRDDLQATVVTAPDPERPGGTLVFCQAVLYDPDPGTVYVAEHGNRATDAAEDLLVKVEEFARELGGPVRGGILLMQPNGDWKNVYFDGKRWINVVYLEWQTAASMGFE
ncbi:hypothetical protein F4820DRAFT_82301 [Hypoxylon rubiginosum]|uniref:Uncharacterized protein n=1 Tax=Hypoxylon rubiginosum TaxID=110542 RepID=A0ACB9YPS5_9PEZI|nr:hypothetical protein F4820DRAFT_82301 [Hypoxylon rubiginosum]